MKIIFFSKITLVFDRPLLFGKKFTEKCIKTIKSFVLVKLYNEIFKIVYTFKIWSHYDALSSPVIKRKNYELHVNIARVCTRSP